MQGGADANTTGEEVYYYNVTYEPNSNVSGYGDEVMGTWAFTYDTLNRLATATEGAGPTPPAGMPNAAEGMLSDYCWSYDAFGNRTQQLGATTAFPSGSGGPTICSTSQPQFTYSANNRILTSPTGAPVYDASGDITTGTDGNVYLYDAEGRICAVNRGGIMKGYVYDASGTRVAKGPITKMSCDPTTNGFETSGEESDYIHDQSGRPVTKTTMNSNGTMQWNYTNVYANGVLFATYDQQGLHFQLNDWLGTRRVTTDSAGVVEQTCASLPYGDQLNCSGSDDAPNEQHFTGKTHDDESGLDYFGARYYSENDARFMSPDWSSDPEAVPYTDLTNPQSLNLYEYMGDNPLGGVDPDGHLGNCTWTDTGDGGELLCPMTPIQLMPVAIRVAADVLELWQQLQGWTPNPGQAPNVNPFGQSGLPVPSANCSCMLNSNQQQNNKQHQNQQNQTKRTSPNQMQKQVERGQAPKTVERVDQGIGPHEQNHIHFTDGSALNEDGTWKHGGRPLTNAETDWIKKNGWNTPQ